jgi:hypothetical protein
MADGLDHPVSPVVGQSRLNQENVMMEQNFGWLDGWLGGGASEGTRVWTVVGLLVVALLVVVIGKRSRK